MGSDLVGFLWGGASGHSQPWLECGNGLDTDSTASGFRGTSVLSH